MDNVGKLLRPIDDSIGDRLGIVAGELRAAPAAAGRLAVVGFVGGQQDAAVPGMARLAAAVLAAELPGRGRLDVRAVR